MPSDRFTVETGVCLRHPHYPDTNTFDNRYICDCPPNAVQKARAMYAAFTGPPASDSSVCDAPYRSDSPMTCVFNFNDDCQIHDKKVQGSENTVWVPGKRQQPAPELARLRECACSHVEAQHPDGVCVASNPREHEADLGVCYCLEFDTERDDKWRWQRFVATDAALAPEGDVDKAF